MLGADFMSTQIEQIGHSRMGTEKPLSLPHRFELPHTSPSNPSRLMGLLGPIILILLSAVDRLTADSYTPLSQKIFDVPVAKIESIVKPGCIGDDIGWKSVALVCIHGPMISIWGA